MSLARSSVAILLLLLCGCFPIELDVSPKGELFIYPERRHFGSTVRAVSTEDRKHVPFGPIPAP
jgi:hypothetical protein